MSQRIIYLHQEAPAKPDLHAPCNGCGVCCTVETCPSGMLLFLRRRGPCPALRWSAPARRYFCGLVQAPQEYLHFLPRWAVPMTARLFQRWIASGIGCDSNVEASPSQE